MSAWRGPLGPVAQIRIYEERGEGESRRRRSASRAHALPNKFSGQLYRVLVSVEIQVEFLGVRHSFAAHCALDPSARCRISAHGTLLPP